MKILIVGAGEVGFHVAERLSQENQDVVLIDDDPERAEFAAQQLDALTVVGNGASLAVLEKAGVKGAEMLLAVTSQDEVNLISCLAAKRLGVTYTVARVSNPEYHVRGSVLGREQLGIDLMVNPERECAWETYQLLQSAVATDVAQFADGRVQLVGQIVPEGAPVVGKTLAQLDRELEGSRFITAAIVRNGATFVPRGGDQILVGDKILILAPKEEVPKIPPLVGAKRFTLRRVIIAGGSQEGEELAYVLEEHGIECTILDRDRRRCVELAERLPKSLVLHADATDLELLEMEGVAGVDSFVAATGNDETNLLSSLLAKTLGAKKVVSLIHKFEYLPLVPRVSVDAAVSPRMSTVNAMLRYVRRGRVMSVAGLAGVGAEAIEFAVVDGAKIVGTPLHELQLPRGALVGTVIRGNDVIIPRGDHVTEVGDDVIMIAVPEVIPEIEKLFA